MTKYIVHIEAINQGSYNMGVGFVVNNLFITSGHVVARAEKVYFTFDSKHYSLDPSDFALVCSNPQKKPYELDVAVYILPKITNSPLKLADKVPPLTTRLINWHYNHIIENCPISSNNAFLNHTIETWDLESTEGFVNALQDNQYYFQCTMDFPLKQGFSGSPLIKNNYVYGILFGGEDTESKECVFLSSKAIIESLCNIGIII